MELKIKAKTLEVGLKVSPEGGYLSAEVDPVGITLNFNHPFLGEFSLITSPAGRVNFGLTKFVEIAKGLLYARRGVFLRSYAAVKPYLDHDWLRLLENTLGDKVLKNWVLEATLGSFEPDGFLEREFDPERLAEEFFYGGSLEFYTRAVGFGYRRETFEDERGNLTLGVGDPIYALWERENEHDPNAVALYHGSGEKLGFVRRTYAPFLKELLRERLLLKGEIIALFPDSPPSEAVFVRIFL